MELVQAWLWSADHVLENQEGNALSADRLDPGPREGSVATTRHVVERSCILLFRRERVRSRAFAGDRLGKAQRLEPVLPGPHPVRIGARNRLAQDTNESCLG